jgi:mannosyltransferase
VIERDRLHRAAAVAGPTIAAAVLCAIELTSRSIDLDEAASVTIASQHGGAFGSAVAHDGGNMSGYYTVMHVLTGVFGNGPLVLRLPSALAMTATVALVAVLGMRLFDLRVALAAGLLSAVSLPLIVWGQEARGYAPMVAFVAASFLALVVALERSASGRQFRWPAIAYAVALLLALYSSFAAILVVPVQAGSVLWLRRRRSVWPLVAALGAVGVCCVPLVVLAAERGTGQLFWVPRPNLTGEKQVLEALTSAGLEPNFHLAATGWPLLVVTTLAVLLAGVIVGRRAAGGQLAVLRGPLLALAWLLVPVALAWAESFIGQPLFLPRNVLLVLPAVALLLAWGIFALPVPARVAWSLLAGLIALRALSLAPSYGVSPENWRAATALVRSSSRPGDCSAFYPLDGRMAFGYYVGRWGAAARMPRAVLPAASWSSTRPYVERYAALTPAAVAEVRSTCARLWLVSSHEGQPDGPPTSRANRARYLRLRAALESSYASHFSVAFGYAAPVRVELLSRRARA